MAGSEDSQFDRVAEVFATLCELSGGDRQAALEKACDGDAELEKEVRSLLAQHDGTGVLPSPATLTAIPGAGAVPGDEPVPEQISHYRILEKIAEGGMGSVYLAEQSRPMRRRVALKLLKAGMDSRQVVARFEAERQALALMDHPNIARVIDGGVSEQGRPFFAMEYVPGESLTAYCDRRELSLRQRLRVLVKVCAAVQHAHQKGVVHRDLKPSNVLVSEDDGSPEPKVIDFGIAKAVGASLSEATLYTAHGLVVGTPEYMSPEQADGRVVDIDTRSDVYSLGLLLYELLVGRLPFDREALRAVSVQEALRVLREQEPPRPSARLGALEGETRDRIGRERSTTVADLRRELSRDLDWVVLRALEKDRERRYSSVSELAADIERYLRGEPVEAGPPSVSYRVGKFVRRHRLEVAGAALFVVVLAGSAIAIGMQAQRLGTALEESRQATRRAESVTGVLIDAFREADPTQRTVDGEATAREILERGVLNLEQSTLDPELRAALSGSMADAFLGLNDVPRAAELAATAVAAAEAAGGEALAAALIVNSRVERARSQYVEAEAFAQRAVEHADSAELAVETRVRARQGLATDLNRQGRFAAAEVVLDEATTLAERTPELDPVLRSDLLLTRAENAHSLANYPDSLELANRALERLTEDSANPVHWAEARHLVAMSLYELGRLQEAIEVAAESYDIARERLGEEHPLTRSIRDKYALRLHFTSRGREALKLYDESVATSRRIDPNGPILPSQLNNLGLIQQGLDMLPEAEATFREAIVLQTAIVGTEHPNPGYHLMNLARVLQDAGRFDEAEDYYKQAVDLWTRLLPEDHTLVGNVEIWYGGLLAETGRAAEGLPRIEHGLAIRDADRGATDWQTAEARSWRGVALAELGEYREAEPLLLEAYANILEQRGRDWRRTHWALHRILGFYDLTGDRAAFEHWRADHEELYGEFPGVDPERRWGLPRPGP